MKQRGDCQIPTGDGAKLTVAQVVSGLGHGGVEMVLYRYFSHINPDHYNWLCISYTEPEQRIRRMFEELGFKVYQVTPKSENLLKSCKELWTILRENHVQIVHAHMTQMSFVTNLTAMAAGVKTRIAHSHLAIHPKGFKAPVYWLFRRLNAWTATACFACGEEAARDLFGKKGAQSTIIMHNALDCDGFRFDSRAREQMRQRYHLEGCTVIGHVGCFSEQKNHSFLLQVFAQYHKQNANSRLILVGSGSLLDQMKKLVAQLGLDKSVLFVPPTDEVNRWYVAMDVFVLPSLYEGLPLVALEAQIAGLPVVLSSTVSREAALSEKARFVALEDGPAAWCAHIREAQSEGRGGDLREELRRRHLDIAQEAPKLDRFYRTGVWE